MNQHFEGWAAVARALRACADVQLTAAGTAGTVPYLNLGQCASLQALADRITKNGVIIADEVGMGKTRIATALAKCVVEAGGRVAIVIPPGLGFQWQSELHTAAVKVPALLRGLWSYHKGWQPSSAGTVKLWFDEQVLLISHAFSNWRLSAGSERSALLPELIARWSKRNKKNFPPGYDVEHALERFWGGPAARAISDAVPDDSAHEAHRFLDEVHRTFTWTHLQDSEQYTKQGALREALERAVGLGLGSFDLIIIDEAHKGRRLDSGLSTVLDRVLLSSSHVRRVSLTATPVELNVDQWWNTLARIGVDERRMGFRRDDESSPIQRYAKAVQRLRAVWRTSAAARDEYKEAAKAFTAALSPFLLRRDKRQDPAVRRFVAYTGLPFERYRRHDKVAVEPGKLSLSWRRAICAAESLSLVARSPADSERHGQRLRLTIGNGHGIAGLIDQYLADAVEDESQRQHEVASGDALATHDVSDGTTVPDLKRAARRRWWSETIAQALRGKDDAALLDHPAIRAAVDSIEACTREGEKVLVFGRFTRPLQALVGLLNAREMLRRIGQNRPWPQSKVHGDASAGTGEWPAVRAAYRQLYERSPGASEERGIDEALGAQYRRIERHRLRFRDGLIPALERAFGQPGESPPAGLAHGRDLLAAFSDAVDQAENNEDIGIVARAISGLLPDHMLAQPLQDQAVARAFLDLVKSANARDAFDAEDEIEGDEEARAKSMWEIVMERLREEYTRPEGGFARLMNGNTKPESRRMIQVAFNRHGSFPQVLVAQSMVGREGLNLHEACRTVLLLHPEWNPGVVEQQIGRVDRVASHWSMQMERVIDSGAAPLHCPFIDVRAVIFDGTYDAENWRVLLERWDELRAQLHGIPVPTRLAGDDPEARAIIADLCEHAPDFTPRASGG